MPNQDKYFQIDSLCIRKDILRQDKANMLFEELFTYVTENKKKTEIYNLHYDICSVKRTFAYFFHSVCKRDLLEDVKKCAT